MTRAIFKTSPMFDSVEIVRADGTSSGERCWICLTPLSGPDCPKCGPPEPWGPTEEEEREARRLERTRRGR